MQLAIIHHGLHHVEVELIEKITRDPRQWKDERDHVDSHTLCIENEASNNHIN